MLLRDIGSLLPYHTHVDPALVVSSLNRMIDDVSAGKTIFYDIYTDVQKQAEPSRRDTGPFFPQREARRSVRGRLAGRRVRVRRVCARGLPLRRRDQ
jgi:hypothetical protein